MTREEKMEKQLSRLSSKVDLLTELYKDSLVRTAQKSVYTVADIARIKGVSTAHLRRVEPYLMPRNGRSGYPDGPIRWDVEEYIDWNFKPLEERRAAWKAQREK